MARIRDSRLDVWRTATLTAPAVIQGVFAIAIGVGWLLGHLPSYDFRLLVAAATVITTIASLLVAAALWHADSARRRGIGLAVGGSGLVGLTVGLAYALIFLPWLENGA